MHFDPSTEDTETHQRVAGEQLTGPRRIEHLTPAFGHPSPRRGEGLSRLSGAVFVAADLSTEDTENTDAYARRDRGRPFLCPLCSLWIVTDASSRRLSQEVC